MKIKYIKSTLVASLTLLAFNFVKAQNLELTWGNQTEKKNPGATLGRVIFKDNNHYQFVLEPEAGINNNKYMSSYVLRNNLQHITESTIDIPQKHKGKDMGHWSSFNINGKIISFLSSFDQKTEIITLYCLIIDENGKVVNEILVDELVLNGKNDSRNFKILYIENQKQFLILHSAGASKKGKEELNLKLFKEDLSLAWERNVALPYSSEQYDIISYQVDEASNLFIYGNLSLDKKSTQKIVMAYDPQSQKLQEKIIPFGNARSVSDVRFNYENGHLNFTGFYSNDKEAMQGVFFTQLNSKTLNTTLEKLIPFSKSDMLKFTSEKSLQKESGISENFDIRQIIKKENGDIFITAEVYKQKVIMNGSDREYVYNYDDIMIIGINKNLELKWMTKVNKLQFSNWVSAKYNSFATISDNQNLYILYNDIEDNNSSNNKNGEWGNKKIETTYESKFMITAAIINLENGELKREIVYKPAKKEKPLFVPKYSSNLTDNQLLIYAERYNIYKFGVFSVK